jgi:hypothetical protein
MATVGKLIVIKSKSLQVEFTNAKGKVVQMQVPEAQMATPLMDAKERDIDSLQGVEVDLDVVAGLPKNIRFRGDRWSNLM